MFNYFEGLKVVISIISLWASTASSSSVGKHDISVTGIEQVQLLASSNNRHGGVVVELKELVDPEVFVSILIASLYNGDSRWVIFNQFIFL